MASLALELGLGCVVVALVVWWRLRGVRVSLGPAADSHGASWRERMALLATSFGWLKVVRMLATGLAITIVLGYAAIASEDVIGPMRAVYGIGAALGLVGTCAIASIAVFKAVRAAA